MSATNYEELAERHGIVLLLQFGSTVTGTTHPRSDLDLAVLLDRSSISFEAFERLQDDLQALNPGRTVDLVVLNRADPLLFKKVTESCRILYGPKRKLHELEMLAFKQYQDHRRYFELERRYVDRVFGIERR